MREKKDKLSWGEYTVRKWDQKKTNCPGGGEYTLLESERKDKQTVQSEEISLLEN